jgi:hypothetical protein
MPAGRPTEITSDVIDAVAKGVRQGMSVRLAARMVGHSYISVKCAMDRNPDFHSVIAQAMHQALEPHLDRIRTSEDWRASAWFLARSQPIEFSEPAAIRAALQELMESEHGQSEVAAMMEQHGYIAPLEPADLIDAILERLNPDEAIKAIQERT